MIGRLTGEVVECSPGSVLLDVAGVGYALQIPLSTFYALSSRRGGRAVLHVHTHVREDALLLYGFATAEERGAFEQLIGISGVGPRTALAVLSGIGVEDFERAVRDGDRAQLERIPGIGRKTAERILLEMRDRLEPAPKPRKRGAVPAPTAPAGERRGGLRADAVSALVNLGYAWEAAERAVDSSLHALGEEDGTLEAVLKGALRGLVR